MGAKFLLKIDNPCHENWDHMTPNERGRFCGNCQKTVVDFTAMSDAEVVRYLSRAGQHVCGRFEDRQLRVPMSVKQEGIAARGRRIWYWLVAGLLMVTRVQGQRTMGKVKASPTHVVAKPVAVTGAPVAVDVSKPVVDSFKVLPEVVVRGYATTSCRMVLGGMIAGVRVTKLDKIKDTLVTVGVLPKQPLKVYPSPVQRGAAMQLSWDTVSGVYRVGLYNLSGALIFERPMQVSAAKQVDLLEVPPTIAAGVYVLRVAGAGRPFGRKIVVM